MHSFRDLETAVPCKLCARSEAPHAWANRSADELSVRTNTTIVVKVRGTSMRHMPGCLAENAGIDEIMERLQGSTHGCPATHAITSKSRRRIPPVLKPWSRGSSLAARPSPRPWPETYAGKHWHGLRRRLVNTSSVPSLRERATYSKHPCGGIAGKKKVWHQHRDHEVTAGDEWQQQEQHRPPPNLWSWSGKTRTLMRSEVRVQSVELQGLAMAKHTQETRAGRTPSVLRMQASEVRSSLQASARRMPSSRHTGMLHWPRQRKSMEAAERSTASGCIPSGTRKHPGWPSALRLRTRQGAGKRCGGR